LANARTPLKRRSALRWVDLDERLRCMEKCPKFVDNCPMTKPSVMENARLKLEQKLNREVHDLIKNSRMQTYQLKVIRNITYDDFLSNKMLIIGAIRTGISFKFFSLIMESAPFTETDWTEFLSISTKSMQRYKAVSAHRFKPVQSEKIIEIAEVSKAGLDVFGDMDKLKLWLATPNYALGKLTPMELLKDSYGKELVMRELIHIEHGVLA
jgi:putative toxin-antitoxin system antitoxin component (TIGR02293 family)